MLGTTSIAVIITVALKMDCKMARKRRRKKARNGNLSQAGIALGGTTKSIPIAPDILSALMLQAGCPMVSEDFSSAQFTAQADSKYAK